ncbi:glutathione S-transferase family protein [Kiloniella sp.]|uniref:glutathione S-transferase family protein n=1 Tax=Kiloniella sp. TaxID=1938587 RepID=UPI003B02930B
MITLFHGQGSCSLAVKAALALTDTDYQVTKVNLGEGEHLSDEFKKINPLGKVPAIEVGGEFLTEGAAILLHLAERAPNAKLLPEEGSLARAEAYKWLMFMYSNIHPHYARAFVPGRYGDDEADVKTKAEVALHNLFEMVDAQLGNNDFINGKELSLADLYLMVCIHWEGVLSKSITGTYKNIARYKKHMFEQPVIGEIYRTEYAN